MNERFEKAAEAGLTAFCNAWLGQGNTSPGEPIEPVKKYPFPDWFIDNAKITYAFSRPDGKPYEEPLRDALANPKGGLIVHDDGSLTMFVDENSYAKTPGGSAPRVEVRAYKNMATKENWQYNDDFDMPEYGFIIDQLPPVGENMYFGQIHGESSAAIMKMDCGKGKFHAILARDLTSGRATLESNVIPLQGYGYTARFGRKSGKTIYTKIKDYDTGNMLFDRHDDGLVRRDTFFPKVGIYGSKNFKGRITFFAV